MTHDEIKLMPRTQTILYSHVVADFLSTKGRPALYPHHCRREPHQLNWGTLDTHRRFDHIKVDAEHRIKHGGGKIHVFGH